MYGFCICLHAWVLSVYISLCASVCVCVGDRKDEIDSEWRTNPFGHIAESNTKCQNLIISIIIFIIFIHFLPARLNAVSLFFLPLPPLAPLYINLFFPSIALTTGDMWACQSCWLTALKWPTEKRLVFSFFFWSDVVLVTPGLIRKPNLLQFLWAKRGCHSCWLTALRFAGCSVGISFKLLCFSFFLYCQRLLCCTLMYTHTLHAHTHTRSRHISCMFALLQTLLFGFDHAGDFDWRVGIHSLTQSNSGSSSALWAYPLG